ncbi:DNA-methyltransferase [Paenibacillus terrae]|uniref:DNA-methyltransferase n=1 Tax=Paenibacillus terrae TaxID=159743 RepID=UPI0011EB0B74|nr:site-specific DNA-methyltransferase [Paenibacillus terrae]
MSQMDTDTIDLTVTSPPYDNLRSYNGYSFDFEMVARELYRVTKQGGVVVWVVGDATVKGSETLTSFRQALFFKDIGFNVHDTMIYEKAGLAFPDSNRYYQMFEYMFILSKGAPKTFNAIKDRVNRSAGRIVNGKERNHAGTFSEKSGVGNVTKPLGTRFNIWKIPNMKRGVGHPAPFPEQLAYDHIVSWSNPGDMVFDPFGGSGTTAKMCALSGRLYISVDISEEYCEIARKRVEGLSIV